MVTRRQILEDIGTKLPDINYKKITIKSSGSDTAFDLDLAMLDIEGSSGQTTWYNSSYMRNRIKYVVVAITNQSEKQKIIGRNMFRYLSKKTITSADMSDSSVLDSSADCHVKIRSVENNKKISDLRALSYEKESGYFEAPQSTRFTFNKKPNYLCFVIFPIIFKINSETYDFSQRVSVGEVKEYDVIVNGVVKVDRKVNDETIISGEKIDKLSDTDKRTSKNRATRSILDEASLNNTNSYLSGITLSKDKSNNVGGIFYLDIFSALGKLSQYSDIVNSLTLADHKSFLLNKTSVKQLRVFRKRIDISKDGKIRDFKGTKPVSIEEEGGSITEIKTSKKILKSSASGLKTFRFVDSGITEVDVGKYQYGVEIVLEDGTLKLMNSLLTKLNKGKETLESYYSMAKQKGNYNQSAKRFDSKFADLYADKKLKPWTISAVNYVYASMFFAKDLSLENKQSEQSRSISDSISPSRGNLEGVENLMLSYDRLINYYMKAMKTKQNSYASGTAKKSDAKKEAANLITIDRYSAIQDIKNNVGKTRKFGKDILGDIVTGRTGLPTVSVADYKKRVKQENEIYWNTSGAKDLRTIERTFQGNKTKDKKISKLLDLDDNSYSFLTPAKIYGDGMEIDRIGKENKNFATTKYNQMNINAINQNRKVAIGSENLVTSKDNKNIFESEENLLSFDLFLNGMEAKVYTKKEYTKKKESTNLNNKTKNAKEYVADDSTSENTTSKARSSTSLKSDKNDAALTEKASLMYSVASLFTSRGRSSLKKGTKTNPDLFGIKNYSTKNKDKNILQDVGDKKIPNQIRSVMLGELSSGVVKKDWLAGTTDPVNNTEQSEMFKQNYRDITKIEYLSSVKLGDNGDFQEKYELLNKKTVDKLKKGEHLVCRAVKYNNETMGLVEDNEDTELEIYDKTFILSSGSQIGKSRSKAEEREYKKMILDLTKSESKKLNSRQEFAKRNMELKSTTSIPRRSSKKNSSKRGR